MNREEFPMLKENIIYFDNGATTFKPYRVINRMNEYYLKYNANSHRGDYDISFIVDDVIDDTREKIKCFLNADDKNEIIFTKNTTEGLNYIIFGYFYHYLNEGDEVIISNDEHASNILPWLILKRLKGIKVVIVESNGRLNINILKNNITSKTKVISLAHMTNVSGDIRNIKEISKIAHENNIIVLCDGAQSVGHIKTDVKELDVDFLCFSFHKMCGPTGLGVLYGKKELLKKMKPVAYGGGMNKNYDSESLLLESIPYRFEAGTQNIEAIFGANETIDFINDIGIYNIEKRCKYLRNYLVKELEKIPYIKIYNKDNEGNSVTINMNDVLSGDLGLYLNSKKICVRSGKHCVKINHDDTVRISLYFYNTYDEIDYLINVLKEKDKILNFI